MNRLLRLALALPLLTVAVHCQDWTDEQLVQKSAGFQEDALIKRLTQAGELVKSQKQAQPAMLARIHGDHREYLLKVERLITELTDPRWNVREQAERTLIEIGARAQTVLQQHVEKYAVLEESIRCGRILQKIQEKGTTQEERETKLLRGLVMTAAFLDSEARLQRALRSALGHTDAAVVDWSLRALGAHGGDDDAEPVAQMVDWKNGAYRQAALAAIARMPSAKALAACQQRLADKELSRADLCMLERALRQRGGAAELLKTLANHSDAVVAAGAKLEMPTATGDGPKVRLILSDRSSLEGKLLAITGDSTVISGGIDGLAKPEIAFSDCNQFEFPDHVVQPITKARVFLLQGSLVTGDLTGIDDKTVQLKSPVFGALSLPRTEIQGIALDPALDRLVGASVDHDRIRLKSNEFVDGTIRALSATSVEVALAAGGSRQVPIADIAGMLLTRPRQQEPDTTIYSRFDLVSGDRVLGFLVGSTQSHIGITTPLLGAIALPITSVARLEVGVGGGAMWGFTLIADYTENRVIEVDDQGRVVFQMDDVFGAWDAECLDNGNLLITEFAVSRVQEVDRKGKQVWVYEEGLTNPYDADRLPNGNTLIADTYANRVIEVSPEKKIVWKFDKDIRPFDCDRLPNGNTLICDVLKDRVIEVDPKGEVVWELKGMINAHDADRLPNGNTLVTLRSAGKVVEVDRSGKVVWELKGLQQPSDADRLPNGNTIVAENTQVREFDRHGNMVWRKVVAWAVEVNRY